MSSELPPADRRLTHRRAFLGTSMGALVALTSCAGSSKKIELTGTELDGRAAPDFTLTDQHGEVIRLSAMQGSPVALAFIFTTCPDVCPAIAAQFRAAWDELAPDLQKSVRFLGVTVDPETDTSDVLLAFGKRFELEETGVWHGLRGSRVELETVWQAYGIDVAGIDAEVGAHQGETHGQATIRHTDAIYLIDPQGKQRVFLRSSADPADLASDLRSLATE